MRVRTIIRLWPVLLIWVLEMCCALTWARTTDRVQPRRTVSEKCSNSNYEPEFCLAHTITILCKYLTRYKVKKATYFLRKTIEILSFSLFLAVETARISKMRIAVRNAYGFTQNHSYMVQCLHDTSLWHFDITFYARETNRKVHIVWLCYDLCHYMLW